MKRSMEDNMKSEMIDQISGEQEIESECDLIIVNKLNEVILKVNNIEAKLQPTNNSRVSCKVVGWKDDKCKVGFARRCGSLPCTLQFLHNTHA